ncbi:MAG: hypothetical protein U9R32_10285 [Bacteroidota bacterium]|nr:hypothetical protein [Bacteroidota bacterium]
MVKKKKAKINSRRELREIKNRLKKEVVKTESSFLKDSSAISDIIDMSGVYKDKKHSKGKSDIHAYIIQLVSECVANSNKLSKKHKDLAKVIIPSVMLGISLLAINFYHKKRD